MQRNNYHKTIITIIILLGEIISAYTQNTTNRIEVKKSDSISAMKHLEGMKNQFIGKPLSIFLKEYESHLPIELMGIVETSPWIHPQGKSYVSGIIISYQDEVSQEEDYTKEGSWYFRIEFQNPHMNYFTFWNQFPDSMTEQQKADYIGNHYKIKDIALYLYKEKK